MTPLWPQSPKPPRPRHPRTRRCKRGACWTCTPHTDLRDVCGAGDFSTRHKLFVILVDAGYTIPTHIEAATDEELLAIRGIGEESVIHLRDSLAGTIAAPDDSLIQPSATERLAALIEQAMRRNRGDRALP